MPESQVSALVEEGTVMARWQRRLWDTTVETHSRTLASGLSKRVGEISRYRRFTVHLEVEEVPGNCCSQVLLATVHPRSWCCRSWRVADMASIRAPGQQTPLPTVSSVPSAEKLNMVLTTEKKNLQWSQVHF